MKFVDKKCNLVKVLKILKNIYNNQLKHKEN